MMTFIIKSSLCLLLFYGLYWSLLRNSKLFVFNRYFLVFCLVFSLVIPTLNIHFGVNESGSFGKVLVDITGGIQTLSIDQGTIIPGSGPNIHQNSIDHSVLSFSLLLVLIYLAGLILFLIRFVKNISHIIENIRNSEKIQKKGYRVILIYDNPGPHTFFRNVFLNKEEYLNNRIDNQMLNHELEHIRQLHSLDIILLELVRVIYWFNPLYILYDRAIRINHEYLADNNVITESCNIKNYAEKLFSFVPVKNIPLTSGSGHAFTKRRLMMMTRAKSGLLANRLRIATTFLLLVLFTVLLGFRVSDKYSSDYMKTTGTFINSQIVVKGTVLKEDGKPLQLVTITTPDGKGTQTDSEGRFIIRILQEDDLLEFSCIGYKNLSLKADVIHAMVVKMTKDPDYKSSVMTPDASFIHNGEYVTIRLTDDKAGQALLVIDGVVTDYKGEIKLKRDDIGHSKILRGKEATDKYGERGRSGVVEIISKDRADKLGIRPPEPKKGRTFPEDFPTFQGNSYETFTSWVIANTFYPPEATRQKIEGRVAVRFTVQADGKVSIINSTGLTNSLLRNAVINTIQNTPNWVPAKNPRFRTPFEYGVYLKFRLPDKVTKDDAMVVVDVMPAYPGGEEALKKFIYENLRYPAKAKADRIQGRVIIQFVINNAGEVEDITVLKSVNPLLDAEAIRVLGLMPKWKPGKNKGNPVDVYYAIPISFSLK